VAAQLARADRPRRRAKPNKNGISVKFKFARVRSPAALKDRLDEAWRSIKAGLVRGLSIGFQVARGANIKDTFGIRFLRWEMVGAQRRDDPGERRSKHHSNQVRRPGTARRVRRKPQRRVAVRSTFSRRRGANRSEPQEESRENVPGADQGPRSDARREGRAMQDGVQKKATDEGRTKDAAEREEFDTLAGEIQQIDAELKDLHELEKMNIAAAQPVVESRHEKGAVPAGSARRVTINAKIEPGVKFARMAICVAAPRPAEGRPLPWRRKTSTARNKRWMDSAPEVASP
jgi:hypothetical protein